MSTILERLNKVRQSGVKLPQSPSSSDLQQTMIPQQRTSSILQRLREVQTGTPSAPKAPSMLETGTPEPSGQIDAQMRDMLNPATGKDAVFIGANTRNPYHGVSLDKSVIRVDSPAGILYTTNKAKADRYRQSPTDDVRAEILGYDQNKNDIVESGVQNARVVVVTDDTGKRLFEEATTDPNTVIEKYQKQGYNNIQIQTPQEVQAGRATGGTGYGLRPDGTPKGKGWLGVLPIKIQKVGEDGKTYDYDGEATEYSFDADIDGKKVLIPSLVPTLNSEQVKRMTTDVIPNHKPVPQDIMKLAIEHAKKRLSQGENPFVDEKTSIAQAAKNALNPNYKLPPEKTETRTLKIEQEKAPLMMRLIAGGNAPALAVIKANIFRDNPQKAIKEYPNDPIIQHLAKNPDESFIPSLWNTKLDNQRISEVDHLATMTRDERKNINKLKGNIGIGEHFGDKKDNREFMLFTVLPALKSIEYKTALDRLQTDKYQSPVEKRQDQIVVRDKLFLLEEMQDRGMSLPATITDAMANMAKYAGEIALMGGVGGNAVGDALYHGTRRELVKAGGKAIGGGLARQAGTVGTAAAMAALNAPEMINLTTQRMTDKGGIGDEGEFIKTEQGQSLLKALPKSFAEQTVTYWTEQQGEFIGKAVKSVGKKIVSKLPQGLASVIQKSGKLTQPFYDMVKKGKLDGMIPEMTEEYIDRVIKPVLALDDQYRDKDDAYLTRVAKSMIPDGREMLVQTALFGILPVGGHIVGGAKLGYDAITGTQTPQSSPSTPVAVASKPETPIQSTPETQGKVVDTEISTKPVVDIGTAKQEPQKVSKKTQVSTKQRQIDETGKPIDGKPIIPGDTFQTATGRETTPYPKYSFKRSTRPDNERSQQWLIDNAVAEAESRGDDYNLTRFKNLKANNFTQADSQDVAMYLWGKQQPKVPKPLLKTLVPKTEQTPQGNAVKQPWEMTKKEYIKQLQSKTEKAKQFSVTSNDKDRPYGATRITFVPVRVKNSTEQWVKPVAENIKTGKQWNASASDIAEVTGESFYQSETQRLDYARLKDWLSGKLNTYEASTTVYRPEELAESHYRHISKALSDNKPVPASVLADYPELQKQASSATIPSMAEKQAARDNIEPSKQQPSGNDRLRMGDADIHKMIVDMQEAKREWRNQQYIERTQRNPVYETDEKGNDIQVFSPELNAADKKFNNIRQQLIDILGIKATNYDKTRAVKYRDAQQIAESLTPQQAIALFRKKYPRYSETEPEIQQSSFNQPAPDDGGQSKDTTKKENIRYTDISDDWYDEELSDWGKRGIRRASNPKGKGNTFPGDPTNLIELPSRLPRSTMKRIKELAGREFWKVTSRIKPNYYLAPKKIVEQVETELGKEAFNRTEKKPPSPRQQMTYDFLSFKIAEKQGQVKEWQIGQRLLELAKERNIEPDSLPKSIQSYIIAFKEHEKYESENKTTIQTDRAEGETTDLPDDIGTIDPDQLTADQQQQLQDQQKVLNEINDVFGDVEEFEKLKTQIQERLVSYYLAYKTTAAEERKLQDLFNTKDTQDVYEQIAIALNNNDMPLLEAVWSEIKPADTETHHQTETNLFGESRPILQGGAIGKQTEMFAKEDYKTEQTKQSEESARLDIDGQMKLKPSSGGSALGDPVLGAANEVDRGRIKVSLEPGGKPMSAREIIDYVSRAFNIVIPENEVNRSGQDPETFIDSKQAGFVGYGRPQASAKVSAIVKEDMSTGSKAMDGFLARTKNTTKTNGGIHPIKKAAAGLYKFVHGFHFLPDLPKTESFAKVREAFRHLMEVSKMSYNDAVESMQWTLQPVEGSTREAMARVQAVRMKLIADDLAEDASNNLELPPGVEAKDVDTMKQRADELYNTYPTVREAYDRIRQKCKEITDMLVEEGWLDAEQAKEFYFPHKVIKYLRDNDAFLGIGKQPAMPKKAYLKQREGGADYSTDVLERLIEHWAQVRRDIATTRFIETTLKEEQANFFKKEFPEWTQYTKDENGKKVRNPIPAGYKEVNVLPGRFYYKANGVTEDLAMALMSNNLEQIEAVLQDNGLEGKLPIRTMLALGKKRSFIVREEIAKQLNDMPTVPVGADNGLYQAIKNSNTLIKRNILFNPLYAVPFHVTNFVGDAQKVAVATPKAFADTGIINYWKAIIATHNGKKPEMFDAAQKRGVIGAGWIAADLKKTEVLIPIVERAELSGASQVLFNKLKRIYNALESLGESREDWLRYAVFEHLINLQNKGVDITKYATKDTAVIRGLSGYDKAAKIARDILGDYSAIGKSGVMISDLAVPFYRWMHLNLPWWPRMVKEYSKRGDAGRLVAALLAASAPYIAAMLWNYGDDERRKYEKSLPYWKRWNFHIVSLHGKTMYYVPLPTDDVLNFFGIPEMALDFQRYQRGMINAPELWKRAAINMTYEPSMQVVNSIGGVAGVSRDLIGLQTYPDFKPYLEKRWGIKSLRAIEDVFGAPGQLVDAIGKGEIKIDSETHQIIMGKNAKDMLNRSWMGVRSYTIDFAKTQSLLENSVYKNDERGHKAGDRYRNGRTIKGNKYYKTTVDPHEKGDAHKGKKRLVDSLNIQLEGSK